MLGFSLQWLGTGPTWTWSSIHNINYEQATKLRSEETCYPICILWTAAVTVFDVEMHAVLCFLSTRTSQIFTRREKLEWWCYTAPCEHPLPSGCNWSVIHADKLLPRRAATKTGCLRWLSRLYDPHNAVYHLSEHICFLHGVPWWNENASFCVAWQRAGLIILNSNVCRLILLHKR